MPLISRGSNRIDYGKTNRIFDKVPVEDAPKSGFDMSYTNTFDGHFGNCYPVHVQTVVPSDRISYDVSAVMNFTPLVNPIFEELEAVFASFYVPYRILWDDWKAFITATPNKQGAYVQYLPQVGPMNSSAASETSDRRATQYGSLLDFLGYGTPSEDITAVHQKPHITVEKNTYVRVNALPLRAYWRVMADWYQNAAVTDLEHDPFYKGAFATDSNLMTYANVNGFTNGVYHNAKPFELWVAPYNRDFLTTATFEPQQSTPVTVNTSSGSFTLEQFRVASALDRWARKQNLAGRRYNESIMAHFNVMPDDATLDRAEYLGSYRQKIDVTTTTQVSSTTESSPLGTLAGKATSSGAGHVYDRTFTEFGIVFTICTLCVPASYSQFRSRELMRSKYTDYPWPELCNLGDEEIIGADICSNPKESTGGFADGMYANEMVCGYNERYWYEKSRRNEVHGACANPSSALFKYTAARTFDISNFYADDWNFSLVDSQRMFYEDLESRIFQTANDTPARISVWNNCYMVRPFTEHANPLV